MCLIALAIGVNASCPLLIAANRDEFYDRPSAALQRWHLPSGAEVVAGRDLRSGGTWLGINPGGRVALLTNVRSAQPGPGARSRGELVTRWLQGELDWTGLQASIAPRDYAGFNLVVGDFHQGFWAWLSNRKPHAPQQEPSDLLHSHILGAGLYGLSNAALDTPWPKTQRIKQALGASLALLCQPQTAPHWRRPLCAALLDARVAADAELPATGVPLEWERALSSPFVRLPSLGYGTRSSLLLRVRPGGAGRWQVRLDEWQHLVAADATAPQPHSASRRQQTLLW